MNPIIGVIMGSSSDWEYMRLCSQTLHSLAIDHEVKVVSAHRMPDEMFKYAESAEPRGLRVIIAGAGGAAHLPGMIASKTNIPVLGVPIPSKHLHGIDSMLSILQMPAGVPVGTFAIGSGGAVNAALFSAEILGLQDSALRDRLADYRKQQTERAASMTNELK